MAAPPLDPYQTPTVDRGTPEDQGGECARCGTPYEPTQEYCLECGLRIPGNRGLTAAFGAHGPVAWAWPVLVSFVVAVLATAAVLAVRVTGDEPGEPLLATTDMPTVPTLTGPTATIGTEPLPVTEPTEPPTPPPARPPAPRPGALIEWPRGREAYTVVLASLPAQGGRGAATAKAREAADAGLRSVGVLDSSRYASLHPGYFVVFSGVYPSFAAASRSVAGARAAGFDTAYARLISP